MNQLLCPAGGLECRNDRGAGACRNNTAPSRPSSSCTGRARRRSGCSGGLDELPLCVDQPLPRCLLLAGSGSCLHKAARGGAEGSISAQILLLLLLLLMMMLLTLRLQALLVMLSLLLLLLMLPALLLPVVVGGGRQRASAGKPRSSLRLERLQVQQ